MKIIDKYEPIKKSLAEREHRVNNITITFCVVFALMSLYFTLRFYAGNFYTPADGLYYYQGYIELGSTLMLLLCAIITKLSEKRCPWLPRYFFLITYLAKAVSSSICLEFNYFIFFVIPLIIAIGYYNVIYSTITAAATFFSYVISDYFAAVYGLVDLNLYDVTYMDGLKMIFDDTNYLYNYFNAYTWPVAAMLFFVSAVSVVLAKNGADALLNEYNISKEYASMEREFSLGKEIQQSMLPDRVLISQNFSAYSYMVSAKNVGGDFFDYFTVGEDKLVITIGDVSGKGISASLFASNTKALIRAQAHNGFEPMQILQRTNVSLCSTNKKKLFVTIWLGLIDLKTGDCTYCNAGHNPPIIKTAGGEAVWLRSKPNFIIGRRPHMKYDQHHVQINEGDSLVLYTDGVTEAMNEQGQMFSEERLLDYISKNKIDEDFTKKLMKEISGFRGKAEQNDDISLACVRLTELKKEEKLERSFKASSEEYYGLCDFVIGFAKKHTGDKKILNDLEISLSEIFSNLEFYSSEDKNKRTDVKVALSYDDGTMSIEIADNGIEFNPLDRPKPSATENKKNKIIGGFGIFMVKNLMDEVDYRYEGMNILTLKKRLN